MSTGLDEYPDEEWVDDESDSDSGADLLVCPSCSSAVHEDTQQCPHCGDWITPVYPSRRSARLIWAIVVAVLILALITLTVR